MYILNNFRHITPRHVAAAFTLIAFLTLCFAYFIIEKTLGFKPCRLCLFERLPYAVVLFGSVTLALNQVKVTLCYQTFAFFIGTLLSFYHSGGERGLWSVEAGCYGKAFTPATMSNADLAERLSNFAVVKCSDIPFTLLGLSPANYNFLFSLGLTMIGGYFILLSFKEKTVSIPR